MSEVKFSSEVKPNNLNKLVTNSIEQRFLDNIGTVIYHPNTTLVISSLVVMPSVSNRQEKVYSYYILTCLDKSVEVNWDKNKAIKLAKKLENREGYNTVIYCYPILSVYLEQFSKKYVGISKDRMFQIIQCPELLVLK